MSKRALNGKLFEIKDEVTNLDEWPIAGQTPVYM